MSDDPVLAHLTGPGGAFEVVVEPVLGVRMRVYKDRMRSLRDLVTSADSRAGVDFLVQGERRLSYDEHNSLVRRVATAITGLGLAHGDRVAILSANSVEWVVLFWAAAVAGAVAVPLNAWWKADELRFALEDSGAKLLFCDRRRWDVVRAVVDEIPTLEHVHVADLEAADSPARPGAELLGPEDPGDLPHVTIQEDDLLAIMYTSGTTGPKAPRSPIVRRSPTSRTSSARGRRTRYGARHRPSGTARGGNRPPCSSSRCST